jgi:hypothetical protein
MESAERATFSLEKRIKVVMLSMMSFICVLPDIYFMVEAVHPSRQLCGEGSMAIWRIFSRPRFRGFALFHSEIFS